MSDEYLQDGFDYMDLKVSELRRILQENNIPYPQSGKKSRLREIYENKLIPMIPEIVEKRANGSTVMTTPRKRDRTEMERNNQNEKEKDEDSSSSSSSQHGTENRVKKSHASFTDDENDTSMSSRDSLRNVVVPQNVSTPVSKKRKAEDNSRSSTGTPIVNKVQKKNRSYTADHRADISSLPLLSSDDDDDKDDSISANITNHGKENQQAPAFDFSVQRRTLSPDLNKLKISSDFAERLRLAKNSNKDNDTKKESQTGENVKLADTLGIKSGRPAFELQPFIEISDSSGNDSDSGDIIGSKSLPLLTKGVPNDYQEGEHKKSQSKVLSMDNDKEDLEAYNKSLEGQDILKVRVESPAEDETDGVHGDEVQSSENESDELKPQEEEEEDEEEEREELEEQKEEIELDEEDEVAELDNEIEKQQEEQENLGLELDDELDEESEQSINNNEYERLHQRMDEELRDQLSKKDNADIAQSEKKTVMRDGSNDIEEVKPQSVSSKKDNKFLSFLNNISKFLFKLVLVVISLIILAIPVLLGLWYREQRVTVGYCGYERQSQTFYDIYPSIQQLGYIDEILKEYTPECIPCPENSICYPYLKLRCRPGYTLQKSKLSLFGLIPMSDSCVKDDRREQIVREMVQKSLEFLRTKNAEISCGENENDIESGISQMDLYNIFAESRAPWIDNEEYEKLWEEALQNLENEPEIIMRQLLQDGSNIPFNTDFDIPTDDFQRKEGYIQQTNGTKEDKYVRSTSKKYVGLRCRFEKEINQTYNKYKGTIWFLCLIFAMIQYTKYKLKSYFDRKAKIVEMTEETLTKLKNCKHKNPPYISTVQLRDILLNDVTNLKERNNLWNEVVKRLEANNTNIKSSLLEIHGEIMKCWEWIGPIETSEEQSSSDKVISQKDED
ncbi:similar to Saccharomyces cerevisiae YDR458C HEH2 Inner nuclear membrane (INM) protein [Maudiozyma saulgeensis]|uniref:Similar to Saccharomyces cerevisiae YDR458C HEH2 Inner nuclear membrane (INM) protein n=1 Tax=Maudiozyma saulgeensis TaxID=1789683 RepID=A0A1X7QXS8_9SACH|nr:similar to Saccharomyces cerevisiae YDR458C HEH2 Inner nuclear membrane (INM) protein [Kazachstania saulgeensis]